ncbi:MAG: cell envelope integrity EipB family protein [Rhodospirillaceae bacterium]|nr:cell envelope integrity EipB family protein [Rhodospirillaceae bacterium]
MLKAGVLVLATAMPLAVQAADLPPYEATYELRLTRASATYGPRAAVGWYQYRVAESCDGWETKSHILVDLTFRDEQTYTNERFFSSWEAKSGTTYRFAVQTTKNGNTVEAFKGTATMNAKGGQAVYEPLGDPHGDPKARKEVKKVTLALPPGTLLPLAHARALLQHAAAGDSLFRSVVLNGAFSTGPRVLSVAIGPRHGEFAPGPATPEFDPQLLATPNWQISTAAYNLGEMRDVPNTETAIQIHETGIVENFEQTYFDYALSARLSRLQRLPKPACG